MIKRPGDHFVNFYIIKLLCLRVFFCAGFVLSFHFCIASTYYFSAVSGDDSRSASAAQNPNTPWKSIQKLNTFFSNLKAGDAVMFKRGEMFYGSILLNGHGAAGNPITFSAFGTGANPVVTALVTLSKWQSVGNGIYECQNNLLGGSVNVMLLNNKPQEMGRYPNASATNKGWLTIKSHGNTSISDPGNSSGIDWKGAEVVIRKNHWVIDRHTIISQSGNTINYTQTNNTNYYPIDGFGYFIQNDLRTLDEVGEWYYDPSTKKMYVYFGSDDPSKATVEASTLDNLVYSNRSDGQNAYLTFENLTFKGANAHGFSLSYGSNVIIRNCNLEFFGNSAISTYQAVVMTVEKCVINGAQNNGVYLNEKNNSARVIGNTISNTMQFPGMGQNGDHKGLGLYAGGDNILVEFNRILNTGYIGIYFAGETINVKNNLVDQFCLLKDDGGGIYTFTGNPYSKYTNRKVTGNIILNGIGAREGSDVAVDSKTAPAKGFYADDFATGILVENNTIAATSDHGIFIHNGQDIILKGNTVFNNTVQLAMSHDQYGDPVKNITSIENVLFSKTADQLIGKFSTKTEDVSGMGKFDNNFYLRPFDQSNIFNTEQLVQSSSYRSKLYDLDSWKSNFKQDASSVVSPISLAPYKLENLVGGNKYPNGNFDKHIDGTMFYASSGSPVASWDNRNKLGKGGSLKLTSTSPSFLLIKFGSVDASKKYILRFSAVGNKEANVTAFLRQFNNPHATISNVSTVKVTTEMRTYECLFSFPSSEANACITFGSENNDFNYWLDNIELNEAKVGVNNPDDYIFFDYNATSSVKTINLPAQYVDHRNKSYSGTITIAPYASIVLIKTDEISKPSAPVVTGDDSQNTLIGTHSQFQKEIVFNENGGIFKDYSDTIKVGNIDRVAGYWKFKIKASMGKIESDEVSSPAFTVKNEIPNPPKVTADDSANTLTVNHDQYSSAIVFSENNGNYQNYTGTINVGNVSRISGYWKFKIKADSGRLESPIVFSPAFIELTVPDPPVLVADDVANTLSANHNAFAGDIVVSENNGEFRLFAETIRVGNVARPEGYWKFKLRTGLNHIESDAVLSPAFSVSGKLLPPTLIADDQNNILTAIHDQYLSEIIFSENGGVYQNYTNAIAVGNVSRALGYWKFKIKPSAEHNESEEVMSPAFNIESITNSPELIADDVLNTLSAIHQNNGSEIVVSENDGIYQAYTGTINVGNVTRAAGYWKFKIKANGNRKESEVVISTPFTSIETPIPPNLFADDVVNTLEASHKIYANEILISENNGAFVPYLKLIEVGNVARPVGYWKFKVAMGINRQESTVVSSPAFTIPSVPSAPKIVADDINNTLSASHELFAHDILVSENRGDYRLYNEVIFVGDAARPAGYWSFKIKASPNRTESEVVDSPPFSASSVPLPPGIVADFFAKTLIASHDVYPGNIVYSENNSAFKPYDRAIAVGDVERPVGYWRFKISATINRKESAVIESPRFNPKLSEKNKQLFLYPNPVKAILNIKHPETTNNGYIEVVSVAGQKLKKIQISRGMNACEIDLSGLPSGTFILMFTDGMTKLAKTFIKID